MGLIKFFENIDARLWDDQRKSSLKKSKKTWGREKLIKLLLYIYIILYHSTIYFIFFASKEINAWTLSISLAIQKRTIIISISEDLKYGLISKSQKQESMWVSYEQHWTLPSRGLSN